MCITVEQGIESDQVAVGQNTDELDDENDDQAEFKTSDDNLKRKSIQPRWPTRIFAGRCVRRIIATCQAASPAHFDLQLAKELHLSRNTGNNCESIGT